MESHYLPDSSSFYKLHYNMLDTEEEKNEWLKNQWYDYDFSWKELQSSPESEIRTAFKSLTSQSIAFEIMHRIGLDTNFYFSEEDFYDRLCHNKWLIFDEK